MTIIDTVLGDFFWRALLGGLGVALVAGPSAVLWSGDGLLISAIPWPILLCWVLS